MSRNVWTVLLELLCVGSAVGFCVVVWWPAALLVVAVAAGFAAWNESRKVSK